MAVKGVGLVGGAVTSIILALQLRSKDGLCRSSYNSCCTPLSFLLPHNGTVDKQHVTVPSAIVVREQEKRLIFLRAP
jgi:hypothetical protein